MSKQRRNRSARKKARPPKGFAKRILPTLTEVCSSSDAFLGKLDIAALNLICASGLPGAESLNVVQQLDWIDEAARKVEFETSRHRYRFIESPETYKNSPGYFCCYFLLQVLQEDFGVKYNPARVRDSSFQDPKCFDPDFRDSRDLFIHGIIDGLGGTCASMPVLYVAVGRRLGYPLKLVEARAHLFFRWDDPLGRQHGVPERFNVEGAGYGIASYPDEHYRTWPEAWTEADNAGGWYLKSLSPREELAAFLSTRGECLTDNGRSPEAIQAYQWACSLAPNDLRYRSQLSNLIQQSQRNILEMNEMLAFNRMTRERNNRFLLGISGSQQTAAPPPHGDYCQCRQCQQARQAAGPQPAPGHPPGCLCHVCFAATHGRQLAMNNRRQW